MYNLFRPLLRQSLQHSGIYLLCMALVLAISATTALKWSNQQIQHAVALQAAEMLAADLVLSDNEPLSETWEQQAKQQQLASSQVTFFSTMAHTADNFVMVNVKAVDDQFPLRGSLTTTPALNRSIQSGEVWVSARAMALLKLNIGDSLDLADGRFTVTAQIVKDSNQEVGFSGFSPTVIINQTDVARTNAIQVGSRIEYRLLMAGAAKNIQAFQDNFKAKHTPSNTTTDAAEQSIDGLKLKDAKESNSRLIRPLKNIDTFLQLANIFTMLLCGIAIALSSQRYVQQNQDYIALLRCMGARKSQILMAYLGLLALIFIVALLLGSGIGLGLGLLLVGLMQQLIPHLALSFSFTSMFVDTLPMALLTSALMLLGFVLPSLIRLLNTAPIRVLRSQQQAIHQYWMTLFFAITSLFGFSLFLTHNLVLSTWVIVLIVVLSGLLYGIVYGIFSFIRRFKWQISAYIRNVHQLTFQVTALALGLSLMSILLVLRSDLLVRWQQQLPEQTPNQFVYGLPPDAMPNFAEKIKHYGWVSTPLYPNIRGRLVAKNDQAFSPELVKENNSLRRELNLTQAEQFPADNEIVQGVKTFTQPAQVSVEIETAKQLGIQIGDQLSFQLPEGILKAKVINLRRVEWESFRPNFFFIFSPTSMDANAGSYLASFYVPKQDQNRLIDLVHEFSNTVFIDVSLMLEEIKRIVEILVKIMSVLALLVAISGFLVLLACLNLLLDERKREIALLRSFGSTKQQMRHMLSKEMAGIGLAAGFVACCFAESISAAACLYMDLTPQLHLYIWLILPLSMAIVCLVIGRYRFQHICDVSPLQSLRELNPS